MPQLTVTINDPVQFATVVRVLSEAWGYQPQLPQRDANGTLVPDANGNVVMVANPLTRAEFVRQTIGLWIAQQAHAAHLAELSAGVSPQAVTPTVS